MKGRTIVLGRLGDRKAAALIVDGRLEDLVFEPPKPIPGTGWIFSGVVDRPLKGAGGVIVRLPGNLVGFLRGPILPPSGSVAVVQVNGYPESGKPIPLTGRLQLKNSVAVLTPDRPGVNVSRSIVDLARREALKRIAATLMEGYDENIGLIIRSRCDIVSIEAVEAGIECLLQRWKKVVESSGGPDSALLLPCPGPHEFAEHEWMESNCVIDRNDDSFESNGVNEMIDAFASSQVQLKSGGTVYIESTRALVAVDVNSGGDGKPSACMQANLATAKELPRQLRIRGLGGQVVVDFAPMRKTERKVVSKALEAACRKDRVPTSLVGWTGLGLFELHRSRKNPPLSEAGVR